jgi:glyoxylase-like metal-dependent hydrolase (beta-lactamase superfamily II)
MKRLAILSAIVVAGSGVTALVAQGLPGITPIEEVADNIYRIPGAGGNSVIFVRSNDVVLIDTKLPNNGESIMEQIRTVTDKPVTMVINTHSHPDHVGSNAFFAENDGVQVIAQVNSATRMAAASGPFPPNRVDESFSTYKEIGEGADQVKLYYFGAGHTDGDAFVVFPASRTMMAGDIYAWHMSPLIDPGSGGSMLALPTSLTGAFYGIDGVDKVIQGHGDVSTWEEFGSYMTFNRGLVQVAEQTVQAGGTVQDAMARLEAVPSFAVFLGRETKPGLEYGGTPRSRAMINLTVAFQELRGEEPQLIMNLPPEQQ